MKRASLVAALVGSCSPPRATPFSVPAVERGAIEHVIFVSVDGLRPVAYEEADALGPAVPTLRWLRAVTPSAIIGYCVGKPDYDRLTLEREKGFEPSTSTLATCRATSKMNDFDALKVHDGA